MHTLQLPEKCLVQKKITKAFFKRNFDLTSTEKSLLDDYSMISAIDWIASISAINANVPPYTDEACSFEEIQVISVTTSPEGLQKSRDKIIDLVQKYIPYHMVLIVHDGVLCIWNITYKRYHLTISDKRVLDNKYSTDVFNMERPDSIHAAFLQIVSFTKLSSTNLKALYDGYMQCMVALNTSHIKGGFATRPLERSKEDVDCMDQIKTMEKEINGLLTQAKKESQLPKQIEINKLIHKKRQDIIALKNQIVS